MSVERDGGRGAGGRVVPVLLVLTGVLAAALTGCTGGSGTGGSTAAGRAGASTAATSGPAAEPSTPPGSPGPMPTVAPGKACLTPAERSRTVRFTSGNGASIAGVLLGTGPVGLVLVHQTNGDLCDWVPFGRVLASRGYTALAIDLNGFGASQASAGVPADPRYDQDVEAAANLLRGRGHPRVILLGASLGALASLVAATRIHPLVSTVVDLSGPTEMSGLDGLAAARRLPVPLLCIAGETDEFVADVRATADAALHARRNGIPVVMTVPGTANHGIALTDPELEPKAALVRSSIEQFLDAASRQPAATEPPTPTPTPTG